MDLKIGYNTKNKAVQFPLKMLNRHGLICGSTGSGKTKTVQVLAEQFSINGIPSFHLDLKGDLSGMGGVGVKNPFIESRYNKFGIDYTPRKFPVSFFSISKDLGYNLKYCLQDFGAQFLANILNLNTTQQGLLIVLFKFAKDELIALNTLPELIQLIIWAISEEGQVKISENYGRMSGASLSTVLRKIVGFQDIGGDEIFGFNSFNLDSFLNGGTINILRVTDLQTKQEMFSAFLLKLLMYIYANLPEVGDLEKPKFVLFIDEAHLIFKQARKELANQLENIVRLIRSKGVGIIFCTQTPGDVPEGILSQLGLKIQHTLRAFTAKDRATIKKAAENYPLPNDWNVSKVENLMTNLNIGEAIVSGLDINGNPTPVQHTLILSPQSSMDIIPDEAIQTIIDSNEERLLQHTTPPGGKNLNDYITEHKAELIKKVNANPKFDFYQTIKVVNSGGTEVVRTGYQLDKEEPTIIEEKKDFDTVYKKLKIAFSMSECPKRPDIFDWIKDISRKYDGIELCDIREFGGTWYWHSSRNEGLTTFANKLIYDGNA